MSATATQLANPKRVRADRRRRTCVMAVLAENPADVTFDGLNSIVRSDPTRLWDVLRQMHAEGLIERSGAGVKCDPYLFRLPAEEDKAA